jgi:hypothetical protein
MKLESEEKGNPEYVEVEDSEMIKSEVRFVIIRKFFE